MLTAAALQHFAPTAKAVYTDTLLANLDVLREAGILKTRLRLVHFMAQCAAETGGFTILRESMAYRSPARLRAVWPARFKNKSDAYLQALCADQVKLADEVYGGRMGNRKDTRDGYDYRGGMWLQTTGRYAVEKYCEQLGVEASPQALDDPVLTLRFACLEWEQSGCNEWADQDDVLKVSKAINTGSAASNITPVGLPDRERWLAQAKRIWKDEVAAPVADDSAVAETVANTRNNAAAQPDSAPFVEGSTTGSVKKWGASLGLINELAEQGSRLASRVLTFLTWFWRLLFGAGATVAGAATVVPTNKGTGAVVAQYPNLLWAIGGGLLGALLVGLICYLFVRFKIMPAIVSAAQAQRYRAPDAPVQP